MTTTPEISVVMGVYNGAALLPSTIESVLSQEGVNLEFVIVDDGSSDNTLEVLEDYAKRDSRVKVLRQSNQGLTKALIKGCSAARGQFIARQDAGDESLPNRLAILLKLITSEPNISFVSCGTRFTGPNAERLYEVIPEKADLTSELLTLDLNRLKGPSMHGCTMFRKDKYVDVGGYREPFYFAQDLDLWIRLAEIGKHVATADVLYKGSVTLGSITSLYRKQQFETARLILESARRRRAGTDDTEVLRRASEIKRNGSVKVSRRQQADALYFIGSCLRKRRDPTATQYFQRAWYAHPFHVKSALRLIAG